MLSSRALRCVGVIGIALASVSCGDSTGPSSPNVSEPPRLAPPKSVSAAVVGTTSPVVAEPPGLDAPVDAIFSRWILISGVWIEIEDPIVK